MAKQRKSTSKAGKTTPKAAGKGRAKADKTPSRPPLTPGMVAARFHQLADKYEQAGEDWGDDWADYQADREAGTLAAAAHRAGLIDLPGLDAIVRWLDDPPPPPEPRMTKRGNMRSPAYFVPCPENVWVCIVGCNLVGEIGSAEMVMAARAQLGMTQTEFGRMLGVSSMEVSQWELGGRPVSARRCHQINEMLETFQSGPANYLWADEPGGQVAPDRKGGLLPSAYPDLFPPILGLAATPRAAAERSAMACRLLADLATGESSGATPAEQDGGRHDVGDDFLSLTEVADTCQVTKGCISQLCTEGVIDCRRDERGRASQVSLVSARAHFAKTAQGKNYKAITTLGRDARRDSRDIQQDGDRLGSVKP